MTNPQFPSLFPVLDGRQLTIDQVLKQPTIVRDRIAQVAESLMVAPKFFGPAGGPGVAGGAILYGIVRAVDLFVDGTIEERAPGSEYKVMQGTDQDMKLAKVRDVGLTFRIPDEVRERDWVDMFDQQVQEASNTVANAIDDMALAALNAALDEVISEQPDITGHSWSSLVFDGPLTSITPSAQRPTADWSACQLAADLQRLGVKHDVLVTSPASAHNLRTAYGDKLELALQSAGLELFSNWKIPVGTAYLAQKGTVGIIGYERPLTVLTWPDYPTRSTVAQVSAVPGHAVNKPFNVKRLTGIL